MKTVSIGDYRKKMENRIENMRFLRAVRQAKNRHTMRTEHAVLHNLLMPLKAVAQQWLTPCVRHTLTRRVMPHIVRTLLKNARVPF